MFSNKDTIRKFEQENYRKSLLFFAVNYIKSSGNPVSLCKQEGSGEVSISLLSFSREQNWRKKNFAFSSNYKKPLKNLPVLSPNRWVWCRCLAPVWRLKKIHTFPWETKKMSNPFISPDSHEQVQSGIRSSNQTISFHHARFITQSRKN